MRKIYYIGMLCSFFILVSCTKTNQAAVEHANHDHATENHDHATESEDHAAGKHLHENENQPEGGCPDEIVFPASKAETAGVEVETVEPQSFRQVILASGQVLAAQGDETMIVANVAGVVSFQAPVTDGMAVRRGTPLMVLSSRNMADGDPVQRAKIAYETAKREYDRAKDLLESKIVSEKDFNSIREAYENARLGYEALARHQSDGGQVVASPMDGFIKSCLVNEGDYVQVGQPLASVTQNRKLFLRADVSERYYGYLPRIVSANFKTPYDDKVYALSELKGRVLSYGKAAANSSYYIPVTFEFDNRGEVIPGSFVEIYLLSSPMSGVLALPHTALTEEQGLYFIYIQLDKDGYRKQEVTLGADNGKEVQILTGLKAGEKVVTQGAYQIRLASATNAIPAHTHEH